MRCPFCGNLEDRVVDSRESREGDVIRRRRECARCERRFTSYEKIELPTFQVVKRDQRREPYDREKLMRGLQIACRKRPVPQAELERIADSIESAMPDAGEREISSQAARHAWSWTGCAISIRLPMSVSPRCIADSKMWMRS